MGECRIEPAQRITRLPPYLFGRLNALKLAKRRQGADIIDLGMGNPTDPAPQIVIDKLAEAAMDPRNHRYSASKGIKGLRKEVAEKYRRNWSVELDPETEVLACIGSKEGFREKKNEEFALFLCFAFSMRFLNNNQYNLS